jgi:hypothetical protein
MSQQPSSLKTTMVTAALALWVLGIIVIYFRLQILRLLELIAG